MVILYDIYFLFKYIHICVEYIYKNKYICPCIFARGRDPSSEIVSGLATESGSSAPRQTDATTPAAP